MCIRDSIYCIKVGDCVSGLNASSDPICDESGKIILDTLPWARISDTPSTLSGYGIINAYTKSEVDNKIANVTVKNVYTKDEVDALIASVQIDIDENKLNAMLTEVLG